MRFEHFMRIKLQHKHKRNSEIFKLIKTIVLCSCYFIERDREIYLQVLESPHSHVSFLHDSSIVITVATATL